MPDPNVLDSHVHFWDPVRLEYPWLDTVPSIRRPFLPADYAAAMEGAPIEGQIFVEANPRPELALREVEFIEELAAGGAPIVGIVAFVDLLAPEGHGAALDGLVERRLVKGVRHNIQGNPPGFALQADFVAGVKETAKRGLTFDLCVTHDQLSEVIALARKAEECRLVLDHCGKPAIRDGLWEPWSTEMRELATLPNVWCKVSGLLTEADLANWREEEIRPYIEHVVDCFSTDRVMYGSDWPVLTLAREGLGWYPLTRRCTAGWSEQDRAGFYGDNARRFYGLETKL